jgi:ABC-2 type transport system ATP-binding protein
VPERPAFFSWLRGDQILQCTARAFGLSGREAVREIEGMCRRIAFDPRLLARRVDSYSLGNQKKFSYLQSLLARPDLLIVDEPFSALDPVSIKSMRALFRELRAQGKALLLSSHLISELEKVCDEFIIIKGGRVVVQGTLARPQEESVRARGTDLESLFLFYSGAADYTGTLSNNSSWPCRPPANDENPPPPYLLPPREEDV